MIDFYIQRGGSDIWIPIQIKQRGTKIKKRFQHKNDQDHEGHLEVAEQKIQQARYRCSKYNILFVLIEDFTGVRTNLRIALKDMKALRFSLQTNSGKNFSQNDLSET